MHCNSRAIILALLGSSCLMVMGQQGFDEVFRKRSSRAITTPASYSCELLNLWNGQQHALYPEDAHWSQPILGSHSSSYSMWESGTLATRGIETVAEAGNRTPLQVEFANANDSTGDFVFGDMFFNNVRPRQTLPTIKVTRENPLLSSITMVAPSPDWFSGFNNYDTRDGNSWSGEFILLTYPWDAGTEQGELFSLTNPAENPHKPIIQLTADTVPASGVFLNEDGTKVLPVLKWHCVLVDETAATPSGPRLRGSNPDLP